MKLRKKHARPSAPPDMRLLTLCICFAASLGHQGVLLALAALGLRCLFLLPCMLCISQDGFSRACQTLTQKRIVKSEIPWRMLLFCVFVLLTGTVVECAIVPKFFALILARLS